MSSFVNENDKHVWLISTNGAMETPGAYYHTSRNVAIEIFHSERCFSANRFTEGDYQPELDFKGDGYRWTLYQYKETSVLYLLEDECKENIG